MRALRASYGLLALFAAVAVALGAGLYLWSLQKRVERATTPVAVAAPDLFPPETLLFLAAHRMDESWDAVESWWKRFEPTAAWHALRTSFEEARARGDLPPPVREAHASLVKALDDAEARFGHRPNTRDFFQTYGKYTAFALLPGAEGGKPRMLLVVRLPGEGAEALLRERLGAHREVVPGTPPEVRGFPVYEEKGSPLGRLLYGIGGGFLFVADDPAALDGALLRLEAKRSPGKGAPPPTLAADPVFRRGVPDPWDDVGLALHVRKEQQFALWNGDLRLLDEYVRHAFVLAPADPAIALSAVRIQGSPDFAVRASFSTEAPRGGKWAERIPAGVCTALMVDPPSAPPSRERALAGLEAFRAKAIWKEIDALAKDTPRLRRILEDALGQGAVSPEAEEILRRIPADVAFLGDLFTAAAERGALASAASFAAGQMVVGPEARTDSFVAAPVDPLTLFFLSAGLDLLAEKSDGLLGRSEGPGWMAWRFDMKAGLARLEEAAGPEAGMVGAVYGGMAPAVLVSRGVACLTLGEGVFEEFRRLAEGGGTALAADPLYREALAALPPGARTVTYERPSDSMRGQIAGVRTPLEAVMEMGELPEEAGDVMGALFGAFDEVVLWERRVRASIAATYDDPARPGESVRLMDPAAEKAAPRLGLDPASLEAPGHLPGGTFLLAETRVELRPSVEAFAKAFLERLPGGRDRWEELRAELPVDETDLEEPLDALLVDIRGEAGVAMVVPPASPPGPNPPSTQELLDRIPGLVLFAAYADAELAYDEAAYLLSLLEEALGDPVPYEARKRRYDAGRGPAPLGVEYVEEEDVVLLSFRWPEGRRGGDLSMGVGVVRKGDLLFLTTSVPVLMAIASAEKGGPETLAARMQGALAPEALPPRVSGLAVVREDGFADVLRLYFRPMVPVLASLTLQGHRGRPPEDRLAAHTEGWTRAADLLDDLLRSGHWTVEATVREGDLLRSVLRRVPGK